MQWVIRTKTEPYLYHTGESWCEDINAAKRHPTEAIAKAYIEMYHMPAEAVQLAENTGSSELDNSDNTEGDVTQPGDSGEQEESNR